MLGLVYRKCNPLIVTVVDGSIFKKIFKACQDFKNVTRRYYFYSAITMMKL